MGDTIFSTLRMEQNEVVMCRFLADLLDPTGLHGCRTEFLNSFLDEFVEFKDVEKENIRLESTSVMTEYLIDNGRRIDIMLLNPAFAVPIEAKINAGDQRSQCYDYHSYARNAKLVYLTKNGHEPSQWSRRSLDGKDEMSGKEISCISWKAVCGWLKKYETIERVKQYMEAIQSFLLEDNKGGTQRSDCDLVCKVLDAFRTQIDGKLTEYGLEKPEAGYGSYQNPDWDKKSLSFCPGLNYRVKGVDFAHIQKDGLEMWFRIEVANDGYLAAGFCLVNAKAGKHGNKVKAETIALEDLKQLDHLIVSRDDWWFAWRFSNGRQDVFRDDVPNFKTMNQPATELRDEEKRKKFVQSAIRIFEDQLLGYLKPPREESDD